MGASCSNAHKGDGSASGDDQKHPQANHLTTQDPRQNPTMSSLRNNINSRANKTMSLFDFTKSPASHIEDVQKANIMGAAHDEMINANSAVAAASSPSAAEASHLIPSRDIKDLEDYHHRRKILKAREGALAFDHRLAVKATDKEKRANAIIQKLKLRDRESFYNKTPANYGYAHQEHPRFPGDHFLSNVDVIEQTDLFKVARAMPKGAHLHVHFNACLKPGFLLKVAARMPRMFIRSDVPLADENPALFARASMEFSICSEDAENRGDLFSSDYEKGQQMKFKEFLQQFPADVFGDPMTWLEEKIIFHAEEAHSLHQTDTGAWEKFNARTRMMKGLFNYESAYREYTQAFLRECVEDNIQYVEIRPNFMPTNQLWSDDGCVQINNEGIMKILVEECTRFRKKHAQFGGLKVIYCTPRSFSKVQVEQGLAQCLEFKKRWPEWIAGFDIIGEEKRGWPLTYFAEEFLQFRKDCKDAGLDIPFLFHCGETLEMGTDTDDNLLDALLLGAKRIGHGFSLARHPYIMERMKMNNVCLEVCPISNEVLGLTPRISGHSIYNLLANNVHCTINADNGTLFRSTLSHDFYQVMVGKADMTLWGWRQLVQWSLEHSCMEPKLRDRVTADWTQRWDLFVDKVIQNYGYVLYDNEEEMLQHVLADQVNSIF